MQQDQKNVRKRRQLEHEDTDTRSTRTAAINSGIQMNVDSGPLLLPPNPEVSFVAKTQIPSLQTIIPVPVGIDDRIVSGLSPQSSIPKLSGKDAVSFIRNSNDRKSNSKLLHLHTADNAAQKNRLSENAFSICFQILFPFLMAGLGMVAAGVLLDVVQHWKVFKDVSEIFILVPALLGLKGNLEMTLASRLSTYANQGFLDDKNKRWMIIWGNMVTVEAQAMVVALIASLLAQILGWITNGKWEIGHAIILCAGSLLTAVIASGLLGVVMILVVLLSRKFKINPDNVATPIAASLGDLTTLFLLANFTQWLFAIVNNPSWFWLGPCVVFLFIVATPCFIWLSYQNHFSRDVIQHGWTPVLTAMTISSCGGFVLNYAVIKFPGIAVYSPVMNGIGGNLVAIQASRISTFLHQSEVFVGSTSAFSNHFTSTPSINAFSASNPHSVGARVLLFMTIPGHIIFLFAITMFQAGHTVLTPSFVTIYLLISFVQVSVLLQICNWLIFYLWRQGKDPDNASIPYLTGLGDFLGTGLLACAFYVLYQVGDRSIAVSG